MVVKIIEVVGVSTKGFEDAVTSGVERAAKTVENISGVDVIGQTAKVENGKVTEYHVNMKLAFVVRD